MIKFPCHIRKTRKAYYIQGLISIEEMESSGVVIEASDSLAVASINIHATKETKRFYKYRNDMIFTSGDFIPAWDEAYFGIAWPKETSSNGTTYEGLSNEGE